MYNIIQYSHSGIMYLVVVSLFVSVLMSFLNYIKKEGTDSIFLFKLYLFTKWGLYIQVVLGIVLLFISPKIHFAEGFMKSDVLRFYGLEHPLMMLIAVGLVSIGLFRSKKKTSLKKKNRTVFIYYAIALIIVAVMIPWKAVFS